MQYVIKEAGHTMVQTMDKFKKDYNIDKKVCYCGRLDPMARGLVLLLVGDECKNMEKHLGYIKEYEFEIIFGLSTDTDDPMGILSLAYYKEDEINEYCEKIKEYIKINKFSQNFHDYSSKRIMGKPMWEYTKQKQQIIKPSHEVEIFEIEYKIIKKYNFNEWKKNIIETINKIDKKNNFRQEEIIKNYNDINASYILYSLPIKIKVSSGFYVRQLVADIKNHLDIAILTFDINRINIIN
jgi:tRNA pseudouridine(55) synthase